MKAIRFNIATERLDDAAERLDPAAVLQRSQQGWPGRGGDVEQGRRG